ncbi:Bug family tripartite tricarboxylate transporter substrate binding protein [Ruegeria hyattellae]|uniref:Bug family tripartite tricarboxylate transporter substrate binding protein n=1 Tax=Ruegeria hyattellae TaxID=3233337 RepID=UPI00355C3817
MKFTTRMLSLAGCLAVTATLAVAEDWPSEPIHIIVPYAAGGGTDTTIRMLVPKVSGILGETVVVENKPGGATIIATQAVQQAEPNGYTVGAAAAPFTLNTALGKETPYNPLTDFEHIIKLVDMPICVIVNPAHPAQNFDEFVEWAKAESDPVLYASPGVGSMPHLWAEALAANLGFKVEHVGYKGSAPALVDVLAGNILVLFDGYSPSCRQAKDNELRILVNGWHERTPQLPDTPTAIELGYDVPRGSANFGIYAPKGTPQDIQQKLNDAFQAALDDPEVQGRLAENGLLPAGGSGADYNAFLTETINRFTKVVNDAGITVN